MGTSFFKRGYKEVETEKKRQEAEKAKRESQLWRLFISEDKGEAGIRFLTEEPVTFYEHTLKGFRNGKETYDNVTCLGSECPLCADGDRPTFKGAYLVVDRRKIEYTDRDNKKKIRQDSIKLLVQGAKVLSQLDRISSKHGLSNREVTMIRLGTGTTTSYTFDREDEEELTKKEIELLLPESIRSKYDGTMDSLYTMVEESLTPIEDDRRDFVDEVVSDGREALVSVEDPEPPKKVSKFRFGKKKPQENSVKSFFKKLK